MDFLKFLGLVPECARVHSTVKNNNELNICHVLDCPIFSLFPVRSLFSLLLLLLLLHLSPFPFSDWSLVVNLAGKRARPLRSGRRNTTFPVRTRASARARLLDSKNGGMVKGRERQEKERGRGGSPNAKLKYSSVVSLHTTLSTLLFIRGSFCPGPIFQIALAASLTPPLTEN